MRPSTREQIGGGLRLVVVEAESPEAARCRRTAPETPSLAGANRAPSLIRARRGRAKACPEGRLNVIAGYTTTHAGPLADVFEPRCWRLRALANHPPVHACPNWGLFAVSSALQSPMRTSGSQSLRRFQTEKFNFVILTGPSAHGSCQERGRRHGW